MGLWTKTKHHIWKIKIKDTNSTMRKSLMTELTVNKMEYYSDLALTWDRGGMQCWRSWSGHSLPHYVMPQEPHNTLQWPLELTPLSWLLPHTITHSQIIQIRTVWRISLTFRKLRKADIFILSLARYQSICIAKKNTKLLWSKIPIFHLGVEYL